MKVRENWNTFELFIFAFLCVACTSFFYLFVIYLTPDQNFEILFLWEGIGFSILAGILLILYHFYRKQKRNEFISNYEKIKEKWEADPMGRFFELFDGLCKAYDEAAEPTKGGHIIE